MACYKGQLAWKARGWAGGEQECYPDEMVCFMSSKDESVMRETKKGYGTENRKLKPSCVFQPCLAMVHIGKNVI
jgi:hypothetical protein